MTFDMQAVGLITLYVLSLTLVCLFLLSRDKALTRSMRSLTVMIEHILTAMKAHGARVAKMERLKYERKHSSTKRNRKRT